MAFYNKREMYVLSDFSVSLLLLNGVDQGLDPVFMDIAAR